MIDYDLYCKIKQLHERDGLTPAQIAAAVERDPRTVARWLAQDRFRPRKSVSHASKLDPFKDDVVRMLEKHPYSATQILQRLREMGFDGGYSIVKEYVRKVRPPRKKAFLKLTFAPGECAQIDWGSYGAVNVGQNRRRLSFFVMVMCHSRMMYVEFTVLQTMEHFLTCHLNAFEFFGGVPEKVMLDNLKSAVLRRFVGRPPVLNPRYADFARHYGFEVAPCNVGQAHEKGRVENGVGYVKKNFLAGLDLPGFQAVGPAADHWRDAVANVRIHGETRQKPADLFPEDKAAFHALPAHAYDAATVSQVRVSPQFRIALDANRYSVPAEYAGRRLTMKAYPDRVCVYDGDRLVARHVRSYDRHRDFEDPDHPKELLEQRKKARDQVLYRRFLTLSNRAQDYYRELEKRRMNPKHHVRQIVALSEIHGVEAAARAIEDAFEFQAFSCEYIANLLEQRRRFWTEPAALHLTRRQDLLDISIESPDLSVYHPKSERKPHDSQG
jgi:transposase